MSSLSISLIIMMNRIGPRTVPCGMPDMTGAGEEIEPFADTCWVLLVRKVWSQTPTLPPILSSLSLEQRIEWSTLSNAFAKSR